MNRRGFILGALAAPAVIRTPGLLMPVRANDLLRPGFYVCRVELDRANGGYQLVWREANTNKIVAHTGVHHVNPYRVR